MKDKIKELYNKDDKISYKTLLELEELTSESNELYDYFDELILMLKNEKSIIRVRGFRLICYLAKWDKDNKINNNINEILNELDDDKATSIRQCLSKIDLILLYKPELEEVISNKLKSININKYKESMQPLIEKDINKLI